MSGAMDLAAAGAKVIKTVSGGGTSPSDPALQEVGDTVLQAAAGTPADPAYSGSNTATLLALLKALLSRNGGPGAAVVDGSGTVAAGGSSQSLFSGAVPANGYLVQNNSTGDLWICDVASASAGGASLNVGPGQMFTSPPGYKPPGIVRLFGAATGQAFAARSW